MFRVTLSSLMLVLLALGTSGAQAAHGDAAVDQEGDCIVLTLVSTESPEAAADVYVTKANDAPRPPADPSLDDLRPYLDEVVAYALAHVASSPSDANHGGDVMVELVFPRSEDANVDGLRFSIVVNLAHCALA